MGWAEQGPGSSCTFQGCFQEQLLPDKRKRRGPETETKTKDREIRGRQTERQKNTERPKLTPHGRFAGPQGPANKVSCCVSCHGEKYAGNIQDN